MTQPEITQINIGDTVTIKKGWSYYNTETFESQTSDGKVTGIITQTHLHPGTLYFRLRNGQIADGAISGMEIKPSSTFKLWNRRLRDNDTLTRGQIGQFGNAIATGAAGYRIGGARTNLTLDECVNLMAIFKSRCAELQGYRLTKEHSDFGIDWLRTYPKRAASVGVTPEIVAGFTGFRFVGVAFETRGAYQSQTYASAFPIYRVLSTAGTIEYHWSPWQG